MGVMQLKNALFFILIILLVACDGSKNDASTYQQNIEEDIQKTQTIIMNETAVATNTEESVKIPVTTPLANDETTSNIKADSLTPPPDQVVETAEEIPKETQEETVTNQQEVESDDFLILNGEKYINFMHDSKFSDWITVAQKHGAILYAIPYSDVFAIVKNGEQIVSMSTGVAAADPNNTAILSELLANHGEAAADIASGINHVAQTGESVHIGPPDSTGYDIYLFDGWIVVSW